MTSKMNTTNVSKITYVIVYTVLLAFEITFQKMVNSFSLKYDTVSRYIKRNIY